jgi:hypothetical protein
VTGPEGATITLTINTRGEFGATRLKPGRYKVEPIWPKRYLFDHPSEEVTISDRGCTMVRFAAKLDRHVRSRASSSSGRGVYIAASLDPVGRSERPALAPLARRLGTVRWKSRIPV